MRWFLCKDEQPALIPDHCKRTINLLVDSRIREGHVYKPFGKVRLDCSPYSSDRHPQIFLLYPDLNIHSQPQPPTPATTDEMVWRSAPVVDADTGVRWAPAWDKTAAPNFPKWDGNCVDMRRTHAVSRYTPLKDPLTWAFIGRPGMNPSDADVGYVMAEYPGT